MIGNPLRGIVALVGFIPVADESPLILEIGYRVHDTVFWQIFMKSHTKKHAIWYWLSTSAHSKAGCRYGSEIPVKKYIFDGERKKK